MTNKLYERNPEEYKAGLNVLTEDVYMKINNLTHCIIDLDDIEGEKERREQKEKIYDLAVDVFNLLETRIAVNLEARKEK
jgi:hypothetical protein